MQLKWFDYIICLVLADIMSAGIVSANWLFIMTGIVMYITYEGIRLEYETD